MSQLDAVFSPQNKGFADPYFLQRRENAVVISLACASPCPTCFCTAMGGGPAGTEGADLLAHELPGVAGGAAGAADATPAGGRERQGRGPCWRRTAAC